jgi:hypothetical protein
MPPDLAGVYIPGYERSLGLAESRWAMPGRMSVRITPKPSRRGDLKRFGMEVQTGADKPQRHLVVSGRDGATLIALSAPEEDSECRSPA